MSFGQTSASFAAKNGQVHGFNIKCPQAVLDTRTAVLTNHSWESDSESFRPAYITANMLLFASIVVVSSFLTDTAQGSASRLVVSVSLN